MASYDDMFGLGFFLCLHACLGPFQGGKDFASVVAFTEELGHAPVVLLIGLKGSMSEIDRIANDEVPSNRSVKNMIGASSSLRCETRIYFGQLL